MVNTLALPIIRLVQRLSMILTLGCFVYVIFFLFFKHQDNSISQQDDKRASRAIDLIAPPTVFDLKPINAAVDLQARDIFSAAVATGSSGAVENTPKGQLPDHLKVEGIVIADPSQIIIEDTAVNLTYFIDKDHPQAGIKIVRVGKGQMIINYQGQDIDVPITKE